MSTHSVLVTWKLNSLFEVLSSLRVLRWAHIEMGALTRLISAEYPLIFENKNVDLIEASSASSRAIFYAILVPVELPNMKANRYLSIGKLLLLAKQTK